MATVVKDFKVKAGLVVEGANATVGGYDVLKKDNTADEQYIVGLIGGTATSLNIPDTVVKRDGSGNFAAGTITANLSGNVTGDLTGNADTATALQTSRTIELTGDVTGSVSFDGTSNVQISATIDGSFATDSEVATAKSEAIFDANAYTDTAVAGAIGDIPTSTDELPEGTTNLYYTDSRARDAVSAGDGLDYNSTTGIFSADLGYGLQFDVNGQIEIDDNVVATDADITTHSNLTTGVHGVTGDVVGTTDVQTLENKTLSTGTILGNNLDADGYTITNLDEPVNASDAATKGYVDAVAEGLHVHASAVALADSNVSLPTAPATVDGVTLSLNDRVLLIGQTNAAENGIYVVINGDLARAADYNTAGEIDPGDFIFVSGGSVYGGTGWVQENVVTTLGTDPIAFAQFSGAGTYTAGNGLTLTGTEFAIDTAVTATRTFVTDSVGDHSDLTTGVHGVTGDVVGTSDSQTLTNKVLGTNVDLGADLDAVNTYKVVNLVDPTSNQDAATKKYVDDEIAGAIDAIPTSTDELSEGTTNLYFTDARAKDSAAALLTTATLTNITITGTGAGGLTITAENGVADSDTDDLVEGTTNLYFTDERAQDAIATAIAGGTQTNISVTYDDVANTFSFVAENGVADSDTDDLAEGTTNLYFTDQRAVDALEAIVPNFTEIDINSIATQVAAASSGDAAQNVVAYSFPVADYKSAKFLVKVAYGTHTEVSEVLLTLDTSNNIAITEYAIVGTNGSSSAISADVSGGNVRLIVTPVNNGSTIKVMGTLLV